MMKMGEFIILDGKKYISSKRAAESFGYSIDYIGQLARAGKIQSRMIGRNRFIDDQSLQIYQQSLIPSQVGASKLTSIGESVSSGDAQLLNKNNEPPLSIDNAGAHVPGRPIAERSHELIQRNFDVNFDIPTDTLAHVASAPSPFSLFVRPERVIALSALLISGLLVFALLSRPTITSDSHYSAASAGSRSNTLEFVPPNFLGGAINQSTGMQYVPKVAEGSRWDVLVNFGSALDRALFSAISKVQNFLFTIVNNAQRTFVKFGDYLATLFEDKPVETYVVSTSEPNQIDTNINPPLPTTTVTTTEISNDALRNAVFQILREAGPNNFQLPSNDTNGVRPGIVVLPTSGDARTDAEIKEQVSKAFSDEVRVTLDRSRNSGVITPVFRDSLRSSDYIFMMVPVDSNP